MTQWTEARKLKGLFPANPPLPPPIPVTAPAIPLAPLAATKAADSVPALWNPQAAGCWSLLFSWAFGSFLLARNWRALGNETRAKRCMIWFYSFFPWWGLAILASYISPNSFVVVSVLSLVGLVVWCFVEQSPQAKFVKQHCGDQYPRKRWLAPLGIAVGVVCGVSILSGLGGAFIGLMAGISSGSQLGTELKVGNSQVFYKQPVTEMEARNLGNYLRSIKFFNDDRPIAVQLAKPDYSYALRYRIKKGIEQDQEKIAVMKVFARLLSKNVFNGDKVDIHFCDDHWNTIRVVVP